MSRQTFGAAFAANGTNLDLLRLAGALLVLMSHAWIITGHAENEPFAPLLGRYTDGGGLAVAMFFTLSGFLIARSAQIHPPRAYAQARAARIYPAFAVAVLLQTLLLGPIATTLPVTNYLTTPATWDALWHALIFSPRLGLPGVFDHNPLPQAVNGSLWTLRFEVLCYAALLIMAHLGLLRPTRILLPTACAFALLTITTEARNTAILDCILNFLMGATIWCHRDKLPRRPWIAAISLLTLAAAAKTTAAPYLWHLILPYLALYAALSPPIATPLLRRLGDISYGTYLYAFPIQQSLVALIGPTLTPPTLIALATPLTLATALLSNRLIERPALRYLRPRPTPLPSCPGSSRASTR